MGTLTITRGRSQPTDPAPIPSELGGPAILLVGLSQSARQRLAAGDPVHLAVPLSMGVIELVLVDSRTNIDALPRTLATLIESAALIVQVCDEGAE